MHGFFEKLGIKEPVFIGASDGGMDAETIKSLRKKYFLAPLMLFYMKHCNYEKLKPKLIKVGMGHSRNESKEELAYAKDMFETIFKDYTKEKDEHISGLLADLMKQTPVTETDFRMLKGKILLILPDQDFFSGKMQKDLIQLMHDPVIQYVSGGHLSTILKADDYVKVDSLAEAYELCQKRSSLVVGGIVWLKLTGVTNRTIVDLSGLGLD